MATITTIAGTDIVSTSRAVLNTNFANLNSAKLEASDLTAYLTESEADLAYAPISHTHTLSQITDSGALAAKSTIATADIDNDAVTLAKVQNIATASILGRVSAATGDAEVLTAAQVRTLLNVADGATANASDAALRDRTTHTGAQAISTITGLQSALDLKLVAADIADFETTTELNARDTANRSRVNHTGTQAISTITDLQTTLDAKLVAADIANFETTTELNARDTANRSRVNHTGTQAISTVDGLQSSLDGKLVASDLLPYETESELNARDTANRDRANHTGTQAQSTIVDLVADLGGKVNSDTTGITGADVISNIVSLTESEYGAITPDADTLYIITDA